MSKVGIAIGGGQAFSLSSVVIGIILVLAYIGLKSLNRKNN